MLATIVSSSRTVRYGITPPVCSIAPTSPAATALSGGMPNTVAVPRSGRCKPRIMSIVVDLPAPFGPSKATVSPGQMVASMPRTACTGPDGLLNILASAVSWTPGTSRGAKPCVVTRQG
jgi:hypothetical protein